MHPIDKESRHEKLLYVWKERNKGRTYVSLGRELNLSGGRVGQIYQKALRMSRHPSRDSQTLEKAAISPATEEILARYRELIKRDPSQKIRIVS